MIAEQELADRTVFFEADVDTPAVAALADRGAVDGSPAREGRRGVVREATAPPRFGPGDRVITRTNSPPGHTRLPRYARGKLGVVERVHGVHVFPDSNAHGRGEQPQPLYSVRFAAQELWGEAAEPNQTVNLDLWESYLDQ